MPPFLAAFLTRWGALLAAVLAAGLWGYWKGCEHVHAAWDAANAAVLAQTFHETTRRQEVANAVQVQYVDRVKVVHDKLAAIPVQLPPATPDCSVPPAFVRLWNDANAATADAAARYLPAPDHAAVDAHADRHVAQ